MKNRSLISALLIALMTFGCATNPVTGKRELMFMSEEKEIQMGKESDPGIISYFGLYEDAQLQSFITRKGEEMAQISHRPNLPYEFKIVDSPVINAFAVPGGYIYFTRGIMAHFNNEAEFAGVLGHEIGHVTARHSAQQYSKQTLAQVGLVAGSVLSDTFGNYAGTAQQGIGVLFLKFGRDDERQSDKLGAEYSSKIGYDAREMAGFFETLNRQRELMGGDQIPNFMSSHPHPADRNRAVRRHAADWQQKLSLTDPEVNRNTYLRMIDGLVYGENPRQGFVENSNFYHPELKFKFRVPTGWATQNSPQQFQMAEPNGNAAINLTLTSAASTQEAASAFINQYKLEPVQTNNTSVNGLNASVVIADQLDEQGQKAVRAMTYFIQYNGNIYMLMGITAYTSFNQYASVFRNTMEDFQVLREADKLNRQPMKISIVQVNRSSNLRKALEDFNMPSELMDELALLNGLELTDQVSKGMLIKTVTR